MTSAAPEIAHGLETPYPLRPFQNYFRLEGWALLPGAAGPTLTRVRVDDRIFTPEKTIAREDVAQMYPDDDYARDSGFLIVGFLASGNYLATLEVSTSPEGPWHVVRTMMVPVSSHPLMGAFEPAGSDGLLTETTRLEGWVWHPEYSLEHVELLFGNMAVPLERGVERNDVAKRFPDQPAARRSGFITKENLPRGRGKLRLRATTTCGRVFFLDSGLEGKITEGAFLAARPPPEMWELPPPEEPVAASSTPENAPGGRGDTNILFVLYGDFTSNSANHVAAYANELIARGYDCIVAVPQDVQTIGAQPGARFLAIEYADLPNLPAFYRDGKGPALVHAWTTRESVRKLCVEASRRWGSEIMVHLEDNEQELLEQHLQLSATEIEKLSEQKLDEMVPSTLSHPQRAREFLQSAAGATVIIDPLTEFVPEGVAHRTIWPAAAEAFQPQPPNPGLRLKLGIPESDTVIFYHGNVHAANRGEMRELYQAVLDLNESGHATWLVRTGRDDASFAASIPAEMKPRLIEVGFVKRAKDLPALMSVADVFVQPGTPGSFNDYRFPSKLPEFFAIGRPVILPASNLGHALRDGIDARVLPEANASTIAAAIREIMATPELREKLSAGPLRLGRERFSWSRSTDALLAFYHEQTDLGKPSAAQQAAARRLTAAFTRQPSA